MIKKLIERFKPGRIGSALIMTVVLTVLLAIVAVMFVLVARMDSAATSNIADNKMLDSAAESIIAIISKELVLDTPGAAIPTQEYYDYPDANDAWLANLEPYLYDNNDTPTHPDDDVYHWRQISDITGYLHNRNFETQGVNIDPPGNRKVILDYPDIIVDANGEPNEQLADADGDGIADSKWFLLENLRTSKGKPVYAAVRVIDNSAMININTAHTFNPVGPENEIDGSSQMQINLAGLLKTGDSIDDLHEARCGSGDANNWGGYEKNVIWQSGLPPDGNYLPFDMSDELELRYRYCIDSKFIARVEADEPTLHVLPATLHRGKGTPNSGYLYDGRTDWGLTQWQIRITDPNDPNTDRRHLLTTLNLDRLIDPAGDRMFNIITDYNDPCTAQILYDRLATGINADYPAAPADFNAHLAQFAANVVDRSDADANVSIVNDGTNEFYGMEKPYIYISEVVRKFAKGILPGSDPSSDAIHHSYAIELYKEFEADDVFEPWHLIISGIKDNSSSSYFIKDINIYPSDFNDRGGRFYVIIFQSQEEPNANLSKDVNFYDSPANGATNVDQDVVLSWSQFFLGYDSSGDPILSDRYDLYVGTVESDVRDANLTYCPPSVFEFSPGQPGLSYDPDLGFGVEYYWRVDGRKGTYYRKGPVLSFTTWASEPNSVYEEIFYDTFKFDVNTVISLYRPVQGVSSSEILVDRVALDDPCLAWFRDDEQEANDLGVSVRTLQRDINLPNRLKRLWNIDQTDANNATLGNWNTYKNTFAAANPIQPWYYQFNNVGDAAMMLVRSTYLKDVSGNDLPYRILPTDTEREARFDINDPAMQEIFNYITVWPPPDVNQNEDRVKGRININTAPAYVIAQLPWVSLRQNDYNDIGLAKAIVAYRDKTEVRKGDANFPDYRCNDPCGFRSIGRLFDVNFTGDPNFGIDYYAYDDSNQYGYPDLTFDIWSMTDGIDNDLEEKGLIFARISDLVTVRSDVFTAYILVRIGAEVGRNKDDEPIAKGPQKRYVAILDRSGGLQKRRLIVSDSNSIVLPIDCNEPKDPNDKVAVRAFQLTPEAR